MVNVDVDVEVEGNKLSLFVDVYFGAGAGVKLNVMVVVGADACICFDLVIGSSIFLMSICGVFGAGKDIAGNWIFALFNWSCTFGKSTGSGSMSCSFPVFRCFVAILLRIFVTCLLVTVDDV